MITTTNLLKNYSIIETMGIPISPNYYCGSPPLPSYPDGSTKEQCEEGCRVAHVCSDTMIGDCIEGLGDCIYLLIFCWCKEPAPRAWVHWCFYTLYSWTCEGEPAQEWDHTNDPLRTVLFDYNLFNMPDTFAEIFQCDDMNPVFMYARKADATRIRVKINAAYFLP